jgi:hypothetical protein
VFARFTILDNYEDVTPDAIADPLLISPTSRLTVSCGDAMCPFCVTEKLKNGIRQAMHLPSRVGRDREIGETPRQ